MEQVDGSPYVFPAEVGENAFQGMEKVWRKVRTAAQLDLSMQSAIDYDYLHPIDEMVNLEDAKTIKYLDSFDKIFVIEYLPNGTAKVVECKITTMF